MEKKVLVSPEIARKHKGIKLAYIIAKNIEVISTPPRQKKINREAEKLLRDNFTLENIINNKNICSWIKFYKDMGIFSEDCQPAQLVLAKKILRGGGIPKINNIVDLANLYALKTLLPVGAFDWDQIQGNVELRFSKKGEAYIALFEKQETLIPEGEVVYADEVGIFSRYSKDADRTKITESTKAILFVIDGTESITSEELISIQDQFVSVLKDVTNPNINVEMGAVSQ